MSGIVLFQEVKGGAQGESHANVNIYVLRSERQKDASINTSPLPLLGGNVFLRHDRMHRDVASDAVSAHIEIVRKCVCIFNDFIVAGMQPLLHSM